MATQTRTTAKGSRTARDAKSPARGKNTKSRAKANFASEEDDRDNSW